MKEEKIGPGLLSAILDYQEEGPVSLMSRARRMGLTGIATPTQKEPRVVVFLRCQEDASFESMAGAGVIVNEPSGKVRTAYLPITRVGDLSEHPAIHKVSATHRTRPRMDIALPRVKVPQFRTQNNLTGNGVIVGVVDTGIDPNHPDFKGRILRIWDQTVAGPGVPDGRFGLELTGSAITASRDSEGHGSHVSGIAAGADSATGGVAAEADILFVKTDFNNAHIANGVSYIFRVAREMGRPAVINLSLGSHFDAHDGSDDLSQFIDQESGAGRVVCCAAGNEGEDNIHCQVSLAATGTRAVRFAIPEGSPGAVLSGWYPAAAALEVSVQGPNGQQAPFQSVIAAGNHSRSTRIGQTRVVIATPGTDPVNGDNHFEIQITGVSAGAGPNPGTWKLLVRTAAAQAGNLDVWASDFEAGSTIHFLDAVRADVKVGSPGAAAEAVTVGAFTTRTEWTDIDGKQHQFGFKLEDLAPFSSPGPLRNGRQKPDVTAPGAVIESALSADSNPERVFVVTTSMRMDLGTSMATPFITGLVALLLQRNPSLNPGEVKALLKNASRIPDQKPGTFQNGWGFGLVDASLL
jgi:subtilisin family serine protease